jgi:hypothetical protein
VRAVNKSAFRSGFLEFRPAGAQRERALAFRRDHKVHKKEKAQSASLTLSLNAKHTLKISGDRKEKPVEHPHYVQQNQSPFLLA